jgi:hypothetical protein
MMLVIGVRISAAHVGGELGRKLGRSDHPLHAGPDRFSTAAYHGRWYHLD